MIIEICDICRKIPDERLQEVVLYRFVYNSGFLKEKKQKNICRDCLDKIFKDETQSN
jgi:hypothetical protein